MVYMIDLDGCLCSKETDYSQAKPYDLRIEMVNKLYDKGHTIIIWTARGTTMGIDWRKVTEAQLKEWGLKYTELRFGKPYYDVWVDDKGINAMPFFVELFGYHLNPEEYPYVNDNCKFITGYDVYGEGGVTKWM